MAVAYAFFERISSAYTKPDLFKELVKAITERSTAGKFKIIGNAYLRCGGGGQLTQIKKYKKEERDAFALLVKGDNSLVKVIS